MDQRKKIFTCNISAHSRACFKKRDVELIADLAEELNQALAR